MEIGEHEEHPNDDEVVICDIEGCCKKAVWQTEDGKQLCPVHLAELETEEVYSAMHEMGEIILEDVECSVCGGRLRKKETNVPIRRSGGFPMIMHLGICIECQKAHSITGIPIGRQGQSYYYENGRMVCKELKGR